MAADLAERVRASPVFVLAVPPSLALICLRVVTGAGPEADDAATRSVMERVNASGTALLTHTTVEGRFVLRVAIGSVATEASHVVALWDRLSAEAAVIADSPSQA
jgi:aromatic-L-amino-acid decarboxylase